MTHQCPKCKSHDTEPYGFGGNIRYPKDKKIQAERDARNIKEYLPRKPWIHKCKNCGEVSASDEGTVNVTWS